MFCLDFNEIKNFHFFDISISTEPLVPPQEGKVDFNPSESRAQNFEDDEDGNDSGSISSIDDSDGKTRPSKIRTLRSQVRIVEFCNIFSSLTKMIEYIINQMIPLSFYSPTSSYP